MPRCCCRRLLDIFATPPLISAVTLRHAMLPPLAPISPLITLPLFDYATMPLLIIFRHASGHYFRYAC